MQHRARKDRMLKKVLWFSILFLIAAALSIFWLKDVTAYLFLSIPWLLALSMFLGLLTGTLKVKFKSTSRSVPAGWVKRHTLGSFLEHWGTVFGLLLLIISGFLLRAMRTLFQTNFHFLGLFITLFFGCYFLADFFLSKKFKNLLPSLTDIIDGTVKKYLFRAKWSDSGKYISSQKLAFLAFTTLGIGITITGIIKLAGILWRIPIELIKISTSVHDIAAVLFVLMVFVHIVLVLSISVHRRLLRSWFTGTVPEESHQVAPAVEGKPEAK